MGRVCVIITKGRNSSGGGGTSESLPVVEENRSSRGERKGVGVSEATGKRLSVGTGL